MCRPLTDWPHNGLGDAVHSAPSLSTALMRRSGLWGLSECRRTCVRTRAGSHAVMDRGAAGEAPFCLRASGGGAGRRGGPHATRSAPPSIALKHRSRGWKNVRGGAFDRPFPFGGAPCAAAGLEGRGRARASRCYGGSSVQKRERGRMGSPFVSELRPLLPPTWGAPLLLPRAPAESGPVVRAASPDRARFIHY